MTLNKLAIIQARMSSSRLAGKVMQDIAGRPMLQRVIERTLQARLVDQVVVASTTDPSDDILEQFCKEQGIACYRGSLSDVLDRFYHTATQFGGDVIIRLTADCPLLDPHLVDLTLATFLGNSIVNGSPMSSPITNNSSLKTGFFDFTANRLPPPWQRTLPIGLDVEVCTYEAMEHAWRQADKLFQREHVMPYLYEGADFPKKDHVLSSEWYIQKCTTPRGFSVALLNHFPDYGTLRWTVDTQADLDFVRQVYANFEGQMGFDWMEILALLEHKPELISINADVKHKTAFDVDERTSHS